VSGVITPCATAPASPQDRRPDRNQLRVVTYNAEWLFENTSTQSPWTPEQANAHIISVSKALTSLKADIFILEEVQSCQVLALVLAAMEAPGRQYIPYLIPGKDTATGQNVALLTRVDPYTTVFRTEERKPFPVEGSTCGSATTGTSGVSKHLVARFNIAGFGKLAILGMHFLAFPTDKARCSQREAQALVIRDLITSRLADGDHVIVVGDLNDYSDQVPDIVSDKPTSRVLRILREGLSAPTPAQTLIEVSERVTQANRYTSVYDTNKLSQIDHMLISQSLRANILQVSIDHGASTTGVSDHWPVVLDLVPTAIPSKRLTMPIQVQAA